MTRGRKTVWQQGRASAAVAGSLLLAAAVAGAGPAEVHFSRQSWDSRAGLPPGIVRGLVRAADRSIIVGSDRGLARFDGVRVWPIRLEQPRDDVPTIARLLAIDDTLLVLLRDGGLVAIRAGRQRYLDAAAARVAATGQECEATSLCQDGRGNVWVALADGSVGRFSGVTADEGPEAGTGPTVTWFERVFGEAANGQAEVFADEQGTVWLAGGGGLFALASDDHGFTQRAAIPASAVRFARRRAGGL